jgi:hypothetical protein
LDDAATNSLATPLIIASLLLPRRIRQNYK